MVGYVLRRLPSAVVVLFIASVVIFFILRLIPGDPAAALAGPEADQETIDAIRAQLGLDEPLISQYLLWLQGILTGDLGQSYILHAPIADLISNGLANSAILAAASLLLAMVVGGAVGLLMGVSRRAAVRGLLSTSTALGIAVPTYVTGVLLVLVFAVQLRVLPAGGIGPGPEQPLAFLRYLIMPAIVLSLPTGATIARFLAASLRQTLDQDFVQTGIAKGLRPRRLLFGHVVPNSMAPVRTIFGIQIGQLLGGAILVETIFSWPGVGLLLLSAVSNRDYLLTQDLLLLAVVVFIVVQLVTDVVDAASDPRVRMERT